MNFNNNFIFLRKAANLSQEALADALNESRQTIYKWESGQSFPEMDKIYLIAEFFKVSIDSLIKDDLTALPPEKNFSEDKLAIVKKYRKAASALSLSISAVIMSTAMFLLLNAFSASENIAVIVFLLLLAVSISSIVFTGMNLSGFIKKYDIKKIDFTDDEKLRYRKSTAIAIAGGVFLILLSVIAVMIINDFTKNTAYYGIGASVMLLINALAVFILIRYGMIYGGFFGEENAPHKVNNQPLENELVGKINGVIMISATAIYVVLGIILQLWTKLWIVFPIGAFLCAIVAVIFSSQNKK